MKDLIVDPQITLKPLTEKDAEALFAIVDKNRAFLRRFLPWLDKNTAPKDSAFFIKMSEQTFKDNGAPTLGIFFKSNLVGIVGFHALDKANRKASVGYWLDKDHCGSGIITKATKALVSFGFNELNLNRVEIRCAVENTASQKVAKKLGFQLEGTLRQAEFLYDIYVDQFVYAMIKADWP